MMKIQINVLLIQEIKELFLFLNPRNLISSQAQAEKIFLDR